MAPIPITGQRKKKGGKASADPRTAGGGGGEVALEAGLGNALISQGFVRVQPNSGVVVVGESKHGPPPSRFYGPSLFYRSAADPKSRIALDKIVIVQSPMVLEEGDEPADLLQGEGANLLFGGAGIDLDVEGQGRIDAKLHQEASEILKAARDAEKDPSSRTVAQRFHESVFSGALEVLGGSQELGMAVRDEADLLRAIWIGFPVSVLTSLRGTGFRSDDLEVVIAPRRTLARRKAGGQRLTRAESDAAWRLAYLLSLGARVLRGPETALAWLRRPKAALGDRAPMDLIDTTIGTRAVERLLYNLEWGDTA